MSEMKDTQSNVEECDFFNFAVMISQVPVKSNLFRAINFSNVDTTALLYSSEKYWSKILAWILNHEN